MVQGGAACAVEVLSVSEDQVVPEAKFGDDLDADSLDLVELVMALEEEFGVEVPEDTDGLIESCGTLADEGKSFFAVAGSVPPNPGLMTMSISSAPICKLSHELCGPSTSTSHQKPTGWSRGIRTSRLRFAPKLKQHLDRADDV